MRFCNLIYGWALERFFQPFAEHDKAMEAKDQWEYMMTEPLPFEIRGWNLGAWHTQPKPTATSLAEERDLFLALDQIETH